MLATQWKLKAGVRGEIKFLLFSLTHFIPDVGPRKSGSHLEWLDHFEPHFWPMDGNLTDWKCKLSNTRGFAWGCHVIMRSDSWRHLMGPVDEYFMAALLTFISEFILPSLSFCTCLLFTFRVKKTFEKVLRELSADHRNLNPKKLRHSVYF